MIYSLFYIVTDILTRARFYSRMRIIRHFYHYAVACACNILFLYLDLLYCIVVLPCSLPLGLLRAHSDRYFRARQELQHERRERTGYLATSENSRPRASRNNRFRMTEVSAAKMILRRNFVQHLRSHKLGLYFV